MLHKDDLYSQVLLSVSPKCKKFKMSNQYFIHKAYFMKYSVVYKSYNEGVLNLQKEEFLLPVNERK